MNLAQRVSVVGVAICWITLAPAQEGILDPAFNPTDAGNGGGAGFVGNGSSAVRCIALQPDGKALVGGDFQSYNAAPRINLTRVHTDGTVDNSFDVGAGAGGIAPVVMACAAQPDGKVIIGGSFSSYNSVARVRVARVNNDGSLDNLFLPGTGADQSITTIALQPDGKILIGGVFTTFNGVVRNRIARLNADGSLDSGFNTSIGANSSVGAIAVQPDGKVLIGGTFTSYGGTPRAGMARLNADGTLDATFDPGTGITVSTITALLVLPDGKIMIGGSFSNYNGTPRSGIARLNGNGSLDATFNPGTGVASTSGTKWVFTMDRHPDGSLVIGGEFNTYNGTARNGLARITAEGALDASFNPGAGANGAVRALAIQLDGSVLVGGAFTNFSTRGCGRLIRVSSTGSPLTTYNPGTGVSGHYVETLAVQSDGKTIVGGSFHTYNGTLRNNLVRTNPDGSLDTGFDTGTGPNGRVTDVAIQPDGKVIIVGAFTTFNGTARGRIARLNSNGSLDATFDPGTGADNTINAVALRPDGKLLIAGTFASYNGTFYQYLARVNANGSTDLTFNPGGVPNAELTCLAVQPDGKILIAGYFTQYGSFTRNRIARLNVDGALDLTFDPGTGIGTLDLAFDMIPLADGKALIAGDLQEYNGVTCYHIVRINASGSLDNTFATGDITGTAVYDIAMQPDGRILMVGTFSNFGGVFRNGIARLHPNGAVDISFDAGTGPNRLALAVALQADGKPIVGGYFTAWSGTGRNLLARLTGTGRTGTRTLLEGPYSGTSMNDALRTLPSFPLTEPFTAMGYTETGFTSGATIGSSVLSTTGNNAIVDWVLVEMRPVSTPGTVAASRAVLLQRDGDVVDLDGVSTVGFAGLAPGNYCVAVKPRNHLPVMLSTATPVSYGSSGIATVDFTLPTTQVYDNDARKITGGVMVLAAGDGTFNETVRYTGSGNDRDPIILRVGGSTPNNTVSGYWREDLNMDGVVKYTGSANDRDIILTNVGSTTPNNTRVAALP